MKDYRPLLSNVINAIEEWADEMKYGHHGTYNAEEIEALASDLTDMFNEIDYEVEGGERL